MAKKKIDWEQRRYEMAKALLPKVIELDEVGGTTINDLISCYNEEEESWEGAIAKLTLDFVDKLLHRMKNNELKLD